MCSDYLSKDSLLPYPQFKSRIVTQITEVKKEEEIWFRFPYFIPENVSVS